MPTAFPLVLLIHLYIQQGSETFLVQNSRYFLFFPGGTVVKILPANSGDTRDVGLIPGLGRSPGEGKDSALQYSSLTTCMHARVHTHTRARTCMLSHFSHVQLFATLWTIASQAPLSIGFSRQEYQSGLPWPFPGDLPDSGIEPMSLMSPALAGRVSTTAPPGKSPIEQDIVVYLAHLLTSHNL